jgi:PBP1b-binding outer membrane lipoprotein LpoB
MTRKNLIVLLASIALALVLVGCTCGTEATPTPTPTATATPTPTATATPTPTATATPTPTPTAKPTMIEVSPAVPNPIGIGETLNFTATAVYADGSTADISSQVTWSSTEASVATITSTGLVTGVGNGVTYINARMAGVFSDNVTLEVQGG